MSNITLNIVEPSSPTPAPVDPGTNPAVPNTGLFTHGIGAPEATIILGAVLILAIVSIVLAAYMYRRHKKAGKTTKLVHMVDQCKKIITSKKRITASLAAIALLVSAGTFVALARNGVNATDAEPQAEGEDSLTVDVSDTDFTIEVGDEPVFAVLPVELTVAESTQAGYTLTVYTEDTDLVSTTDSSKVIPMVAADEGELVTLADNTYGLSLLEPESETDEVYTAFSTDSANPTIIRSMPDYTPTVANDTTTIYYGFYITPDVPYGTYTNNSEVYYNATINTTPVTFDGNGLYFNEDEQQTTNEVEYIAVPEEGKEYTINQIISGEYKEPSQDLPYIFLGWSTDSAATVPTYTSEESIAEFLPILPNTPLTLYAVWQKATTITYDNNGGAGEMDKQTIIAGETNDLNPNEFVKDGYHFTGWNTVAEPTEQEPGETYADQADYTAPAASQYLTLYAQWEEDILYMQDVATWGSTLAEGDEITVVDSRDGTEYTVARLADNNIWMTQNLDLSIEAGRTYTSADTDLANSSIGTTWTPTSSEATYPTSTTTWNDSTTTPESYDPGELYWNGSLIYNQTTCEANGGTWQPWGSCDGANPTSSTGGNHYHLGNYYNWTAAVAMSDSSAYDTDGQDVNQSICPAGWRLPTYSGDKSYQNLVNAQNLTAGTSGNVQNSPVYFVYGGGWNGSSYRVGTNGYYWSSIVKSSSNSYHLYFYAGGELPYQEYTNRRSSSPLRCVAR